MSAIELSRVSFRYPTSGDVLREVTLVGHEGRVTWLFGPLGAGSSTLLLVAAGLAPSLTGGTLTGSVKILPPPRRAADVKAPMHMLKIMRAPMMSPGKLSGSTTRQNMRRREAPCTRAASSSERGMV